MRNAMEAMERSARCELLISTARADGDMLMVNVADIGSGIPEDVAAQLFRPFVTTKPHGMGVGLSISRTTPTLRLDLDADRNSLADTVKRLQPRLLILDPFVRLHRIDENASGEVAPLLAYLRELRNQAANPRTGGRFSTL